MSQTKLSTKDTELTDQGLRHFVKTLHERAKRETQSKVQAVAPVSPHNKMSSTPAPTPPPQEQTFAQPCPIANPTIFFAPNLAQPYLGMNLVMPSPMLQMPPGLPTMLASNGFPFYPFANNSAMIGANPWVLPTNLQVPAGAQHPTTPTSTPACSPVSPSRASSPSSEPAAISPPRRSRPKPSPPVARAVACADSIKCRVCGEVFPSDLQLAMHERRVHGGRLHHCTLCSRSFRRKNDLQKHNRTHTGEKPYACGVCGRLFSDRSNRLRHQRRHDAKKVQTA